MSPVISQTLTTDELPLFSQAQDQHPKTRQVCIYLHRLLNQCCPENNKQVFIPSAMNLAEHMNVTPFEVTSALDSLKSEGVDAQYIDMDSHITLSSQD